MQELHLGRMAEEHVLEEKELERFRQAYKVKVEKNLEELYSGQGSAILVIGIRDKRLATGAPTVLHRVHEEMRKKPRRGPIRERRKFDDVFGYCAAHHDPNIRDPFYRPAGMVRSFILQIFRPYKNEKESDSVTLELLLKENTDQLCSRLVDRIKGHVRHKFCLVFQIDRFDLYSFHEDRGIRDQAQQLLKALREVVTEKQSDMSKIKQFKLEHEGLVNRGWEFHMPSQVLVLITVTKNERIPGFEDIQHLAFQLSNNGEIVLEPIKESDVVQSG